MNLFEPMGLSPITTIPSASAAWPRVALLLMALQAVGAVWMVEQPISSLAFYHPRLRRVLRTFCKVR